MKKLNKKGFTLVELLAVIVILAVVMLIAVTAVGPLMTKARKSALGTEGVGMVNAAKQLIKQNNYLVKLAQQILLVLTLNGFAIAIILKRDVLVVVMATMDQF